MALDSGSQDGSLEIARGFSGRGFLEDRLLKRETWKLRENLDLLLRMASRHSPDWIIRKDPDEFLEPPTTDETLQFVK